MKTRDEVEKAEVMRRIERNLADSGTLKLAQRSDIQSALDILYDALRDSKPEDQESEMKSANVLVGTTSRISCGKCNATLWQPGQDWQPCVHFYAEKHDIGLTCDRCNVMWAGEGLMDAINLGWKSHQVDSLTATWLCPDCAKDKKAAGENPVKERRSDSGSSSCSSAPSVLAEYERAMNATNDTMCNGGMSVSTVAVSVERAAAAKVIAFYKAWAGALLAELECITGLDGIKLRARAAGISPAEEPR